ncbi:heme exporter protein CcmB [Fundidesulfovibrio butyratiphilus]
MLNPALRIAAKDLRLSLRGAQGLVQTTLMGLLIVFVFSLSRRPGEPFAPLAASAIFWLSSLFAQVLIFNALYGLEEQTGARLGLVMAPAPPQAVWLGKALAALVQLLACQAVFGLAVAVFLGQTLPGSWAIALGFVLTVDLGLAAMGSLAGALTAGGSAKESLLTVVLFPLLIPELLSGIRLLESCLTGIRDGALDWLGLAGAFAAVFSGAALVLFPHLYTGDE